MPPSICARMTSGLTATPQSTAHHTLCTRGPSPSPAETSAICATKLPKLSTTATPRARSPLRARARTSARARPRRAARRPRAAACPSSRAGRRPGPGRRLAAVRRRSIRPRSRCGCGRPSATTAPARRPRSCAGRSGNRRSRTEARCAPSTEVGSMPSLIMRFERRALQDRLADDGVRPGDDPAVAHRAAHAMQDERAVVAAAHVVLARPDELHRPAGADRLGDFRQLGREMHRRLRAPAEAAAGEHGLELDARRAAGRARSAIVW